MSELETEYQELSLDEKLDLASQLILDAPPGEIDDVIADISGLVDDDEKLEPKIAKVLLQYNLENLETVQVAKPDGVEATVILSNFNKLKVEQTDENEAEEYIFVDYVNKLKFKFNALAHKVTEVEEYEVEEPNSPLRESLQRSLDVYVQQHYPQGNGAVYPTNTGLAIVIVAKKLSKNNFWNGRWKSIYQLDTSTNTVEGIIANLVHYYEEGNVQLNSNHTIKFTVQQDTDKLAEMLVSKIKAEEQSYQLELNQAYNLLSDTAFKNLRRQLPYTRNKLDWNQIGYKAGLEVKKE